MREFFIAYVNSTYLNVELTVTKTVVSWNKNSVELIDIPFTCFCEHLSRPFDISYQSDFDTTIRKQALGLILAHPEIKQSAPRQ